MLISTTARHFELSPELRELAEQRIEKLQRFARDIREAHLTVTAEKNHHVAEITLKLNHHDMISREQSTEPKAAIDLAADHIEEQLRRLKDRRIGRRREGLDIASPESEATSADEFAGGGAGDE